MTIVPSTATLTVGQSVQFATNVAGAKWSSSNPAIASVTSGGLVTGKSAGSVTIKAQKGMQKASASVTVAAPVPVPQPDPTPTPTPPPPGGTSPDGSTVPPLAALVDDQGHGWAFGQAIDATNKYILRDGNPPPGGGYGSKLLWYGGKVYTLGGDGNWYRWDGMWVNTGPNQPSGTTPTPTPVPVPDPTPPPVPDPIPDPTPVPPPPTGTTLSTVNVKKAGRVSMGMVFPRGRVLAGLGVQVGAFITQTDIRNTWWDGSLRYAVVRFNATSTGFQQVTAIPLLAGTVTPTWPTNTKVDFAIGGSVYTAPLPAFDPTDTTGNGPVARAAVVLVTPFNSGGTMHPTLQVVYEVISYQAGGHRISTTIQNIRNVSAMDQVTASVTTTINGTVAPNLTKSNWTIYTGQRWHAVNVVGMTEGVVLHDFEPWIVSGVIPRISPTIDPKTYDLAGPAYQLGVTGPYIGECDCNQADSENAGRQELNPWGDWEARLFALNTEHYLQAVAASSNVSGAWCWQIDKNGDGRSILKLTEDNNANTIMTDRVAGVSRFSGLQWPEYGEGGNTTAAWRGALEGANSPTGNVFVDREHLPELNFVQYLLTGDRFPLSQLYFQAAWISFMSGIGYSEADPTMWPGYSRGRNGARGELNDTEMGRGFGRPLRMIARCAWALPDAHPDQGYMHTLVQNNLEASARYIDYLDSRGWGGTWAKFAGFGPGPTGSWGYVRANSITGTSPSGSGTVVSVIGDDSGIAGVNDHGMQTGDFADLSGLPGALSGHLRITRISPLQFSVDVPSAAPTSGVGTWTTVRGVKLAPWRSGVGAREISWIGFTGLWSMTASMWAFPDRLAQVEKAVQDNPNYNTAPGVSHNYYPSPAKVAADNYVFASSWSEYESMNNPSGYLFDSQGNYAVYSSVTHRGNVQGWNPACPDTYYTPYAHVLLTHGEKRGLPGMAAARAKLLSAANVVGELKRRAGFFQVP